MQNRRYQFVSRRLFWQRGIKSKIPIAFESGALYHHLKFRVRIDLVGAKIAEIINQDEKEMKKNKNQSGHGENHGLFGEF